MHRYANVPIHRMAQLLEGKTGIVMGVANKRSIAWGIASSLNREGARLILTYQNERLGENVQELAPQLNNPLLLQCDVASDEQIQVLMDRIREEVGHLDFMVHVLAFAPREALAGMFATEFMAHTVSTVLAGYSVPFFVPWALILTRLPIVIVIALLAGWWPAQHAVGKQIIEAIGYE